MPREDSSDDDEGGGEEGDEEEEEVEEQEYVVPDEYEAVYELPKLCQEDLVSPKARSGKRSIKIFMKWNGAGWCMGTCEHFYKNGVIIDGRKGMRGNVAIRWVGDGRRLRDSKLTLDDYFVPSDVSNAHSEAKRKAAGTWVLLHRKK